MVIMPFNEEHLEDAAALVAVRYREERNLNPILPTRFEDAAAVLPILHDNINRQTGVVARREGKLIGFLTGFMSLFREVRTAYIPYWGHGAGSDTRQETYRVLYASLARHWVANGYFTHIITILAHEHTVSDAWYSLGFGMTTVDAFRDLAPVEGPVTDVEIHRATLQDIDPVITLVIACLLNAASSSHDISGPYPTPDCVTAPESSSAPTSSSP